jgi:indole-3-glycerol phosphate synthase
MSYTVIAEVDQGPVATVAPTVFDALALARRYAREGDEGVTISTDTGWFLTLDELEELAKN